MARAGVRKSKICNKEKYRRSPFLVSYWFGPALVFENYFTRQKIAADPFVCDVLDFCSEGRTFTELLKRFPEQGHHSLRTGIRQLLKSSLLERCGKESKREDSQWASWQNWNPGAGYFHFSTKDPEFTPRELDFKRLRDIAKRKPLPPRVKTYPGAAKVQLRMEITKSEFSQVLMSRRTWREFSDEPVERRKLEQLLWLAFGVHGWAKIPGVGKLALKTSPSGGAMHPIEPYAFIRNVQGLSPGIYHYDAAAHRLELLRKGTTEAEIAKLLAGQKWTGEAAFVVFLTAVFARSQWKYEHPRAYRVVLAEAGHFCQTFCLTATWLGLAPFCTMALADTKIEQALGIDGIRESVLYAMGAGVRPNRPATADRLRTAK